MQGLGLRVEGAGLMVQGCKVQGVGTRRLDAHLQLTRHVRLQRYLPADGGHRPGYREPIL